MPTGSLKQPNSRVSQPTQIHGYHVSASAWFAISLDDNNEVISNSHNRIWNTNTLAWEAATGSLAGGSTVTVNNFPATQQVNVTGTASVAVLNAGGTRINPATEETLSAIASNIASMLGNQTDGDQVVKGNKTPADSYVNPTDAINEFALLGVWDTVNSRWQRAQGLKTDSDGVGASIVYRNLNTVANMYYLNGSGQWDRARGDITNGMDVDVTRMPPPYEMAVASGEVTGSWSVNKFGAASSGVQTTLSDIWDRCDSTPTQQIWLAPTAARTHLIYSDSALDVNTTGSGTRSIIMYGLKTWGDSSETSETVLMNGTTTVTSSNTYVIIHRMKCTSYGNNGPNVGTIVAKAATDNTITAQINPGNGQTEMAIYGVPSTKTAYMLRWSANLDETPATAVAVDFRLMVNEQPNVNTTVFLRKDDISVQSTGTNQIDRYYGVPYKIPGPAIIKIQAIASSNDTDCESGFDLIVK